MKFGLSFFCAFFLSLYLTSQTVNYKVIKDTPEDVANIWVNLSLLDLGFSSKNMGFGLIGANVNSVFHYKNKIGGEFTYRNFYLSPLSETKEKGENFEIGTFYNFFVRERIKKQKVILSQKSAGTYSTTTSIKVPVSIQRRLGLRLGFQSLREGLDATLEGHNVKGLYQVKSSGLYLGLLMTSAVNSKCHTSEFGIKSAGFVRRNYVDVLINSLNEVRELNGVIYSGTDLKKGVFGFRMGVEFLQPEPRRVQGTALYQKIEIGSRPFDGYYFMYSFGFSFKRKVRAMSSFKMIREKE